MIKLFVGREKTFVVKLFFRLYQNLNYKYLQDY
jgi:hypothetical protein